MAASKNALLYHRFMRVLILGGTQFIGRHIASNLLASQHTVTLLTRGKKPLPAEMLDHVESLHGNRDLGQAGLESLGRERTWDACVDVSGYTPKQVRASAELVQHRVARYVYISTASVYAPGAELPIREDAALLPAIDESVTDITEDTYGRLKATCERIVSAAYGARASILRPQIVVGPYDHTARYAYWLTRVSKGGPMLGPGDGSDPVQVVDVRDLARFAVHVLERGLEGIFNMAGPSTRWDAFLEMLGASSGTITWVSAEHLESAGITFNTLPLYRSRQAKDAHGMNMCADKALAAGFTQTAATETLSAVRDWLRTLPQAIPSELAEEHLSAEQERSLITRAMGANPSVR
jgi:2'-hydroxyisoflavone reductase